MPIDENDFLETDESAFDPDPFDSFEAAYEFDGKEYKVTIQMLPSGKGNHQAYYTAYSDGSLKTIDYETGTGWIERGEGQTPHAVAIGNLIRERFS